MKIKAAEFELSAPNLRSCPNWALPEVALIGRSNVGKSSLINSLTGQRDLARISATPGKTQLINFYRVNGSWSLVDLPGYGYAEVGQQRRMEFNQAVAEFLAGRANLRRVLVLIDSRLDPQEIDLEFLSWLDDERVPFALVFTKTDKQSASQTRAKIETFHRALSGRRRGLPDTLASSAKDGTGQKEILAYIAQALTEQRRSDG
jgi:GTP-binding protein